MNDMINLLKIFIIQNIISSSNKSSKTIKEIKKIVNIKQ